jgi:endonuclease YncB( thermonuclease family)
MMAWSGLLIGLLFYQVSRTGPGLVPATYAPTTRPAEAAESVRVIDGDTFETGGIRVRVADIDTPEVRGRCAYETALAARATARMRTLLAAGPFELHALADGRDEDAYGRKLRIVTRDGRSLGDVLVAEGLARTWSGRREPWCTQ